MFDGAADDVAEDVAAAPEPQLETGSPSPKKGAKRKRYQTAWKSNLQPDFNVRVIERSVPDSSAVLRELAESHRFVQKSAESTAM